MSLHNGYLKVITSHTGRSKNQLYILDNDNITVYPQTTDINRATESSIQKWREKFSYWTTRKSPWLGPEFHTFYYGNKNRTHKSLLTKTKRSKPSDVLFPH